MAHRRRRPACRAPRERLDGVRMQMMRHACVGVHSSSTRSGVENVRPSPDGLTD
ncbi:MAG: hypothetical protein AVDCRST_MAG52-2093 [uncultured Blastococcus sp.]|uniref:Uncharacterized protein n=1 Tax=uncultured Blastococcus sp. TaxID=217144 RepID=A0A6J4IGE6_9ACTN|nr:MAG: hypothetical protein AVDCRST_MAG52-2093 [uncultured Blastococcus sp.]